jgi:hypothetical protein
LKKNASDHALRGAKDHHVAVTIVDSAQNQTTTTSTVSKDKLMGLGSKSTGFKSYSYSKRNSTCNSTLMRSPEKQQKNNLYQMAQAKMMAVPTTNKIPITSHKQTGLKSFRPTYSSSKERST